MKLKLAVGLLFLGAPLSVAAAEQPKPKHNYTELVEEKIQPRKLVRIVITPTNLGTSLLYVFFNPTLKHWDKVYNHSPSATELELAQNYEAMVKKRFTKSKK